MKIKNSIYRNLFGKGHEKEVIMDDKHSYTIKNSPYRNLFGEGHEQIIKEKKDTSIFLELPLLSKICAILFLISCIFLLTSLVTFEPLKIGLMFLITCGIAILFMLATFGKNGFYLDIIIASLQILGAITLALIAMILIPLGFVLLFNMIMNFLM